LGFRNEGRLLFSEYGSRLRTRDGAEVSPASSAVQLGAPAGGGVHPRGGHHTGCIGLTSPSLSWRTHARVGMSYACLHACMCACISACLPSMGFWSACLHVCMSACLCICVCQHCSMSQCLHICILTILTWLMSLGLRMHVCLYAGMLHVCMLYAFVSACLHMRTYARMSACLCKGIAWREQLHH
jgi:hypothetical protein